MDNHQHNNTITINHTITQWTVTILITPYREHHYNNIPEVTNTINKLKEPTNLKLHICVKYINNIIIV